MADAKQKALDQLNKKPSDADNLNALNEAGKIAEPGVTAAVVVGAIEAAPIAVYAAVDSGLAQGAVQVGKNVVQGVKNVNEELIKPAGQRVGAALEARSPGGWQALNDSANRRSRNISGVAFPLRFWSSQRVGRSFPVA